MSQKTTMIGDGVGEGLARKVAWGRLWVLHLLATAVVAAAGEADAPEQGASRPAVWAGETAASERESSPPAGVDVDAAAAEDRSAAAERVRAALEAVRTARQLAPESTSGWQDRVDLERLASQFASAAPEDDAGVGLAVRDLMAGETFQERASGSAIVELRRALQAWQVEGEAPLVDPLAQRIRAAKRFYAPVSGDRMAQARRGVVEALRSLDSFLAGGRPQDRDGWRAYLQLDALEAELGQGDVATLLPFLQTLRRLESDVAGLRLARFSDLRAAMRDYLELAQFYTAQPQALAHARTALLAALQPLDSYLQGGGAEKYANWQQYLRWEVLQQELAAEAPDLGRLREVLERFQRPVPALQGERFRRVASRLVRFTELQQLASGLPAEDRYAARLERLSQTLDAHHQRPTAETSAQLASDVVWLESMGWLAAESRDIRQRFSHHNLRVALSARAVSQQIEESISDSQLVNRCFEGSRVRGRAVTQAQVRGRLIPARGQALLELVLTGRTVTDTVAQKRRVYVTTEGATNISASKRVHLTVDGAYAEPAQVWASTSQQTRGVMVDRRRGVRLIGRAAQRQAQQSRPRAEQLQTTEARQTIAQRMNEETAKMLADSNAQIRKSLRQLRVEFGLDTDKIGIYSTHRHLFVDALVPGAKYLGAPLPAPRLPGKNDVALALHESAVNNLLVERLAGIQLDNRRVVELLEEQNLQVPDELRLSAERAEAADRGETTEEAISDEDWAILFDPLLPASIGFDAGQLRIAVRGREFTRGDQTIRERIEISARYTFQVDPQQRLEAIRDGEVAVDFVGISGRLSTKQLTYKTFIKRKMEALFQDRISLDQLPEGDLKGQLEALKVAHLQAADGWFGLAMRVEGKLRLATRP